MPTSLLCSFCFSLGLSLFLEIHLFQPLSINTQCNVYLGRSHLWMSFWFVSSYLGCFACSLNASSCFGWFMFCNFGGNYRVPTKMLTTSRQVGWTTMQPSNRPRDRLWRDKSSDLEILLLPSKLAPRLQCKMMRAIRRKSTDLQSYERKSIIPVFAPIMRDGLNPLIIGGAGPWMMAGGNRAILGTGAGTGGWFYYRKHFSLFQIKLPPTPHFFVIFSETVNDDKGG